MDYLIGDVQGCCDPLDTLLSQIGFTPSRDRLYVLGDLVNRGPKSLETLRRLRSFGDSAVCLLGNHDLSLLAVAHGVRKLHKGDTVQEILQSPERQAWLEWISHRRMAVQEHGWLMVHAGVVPQWDAATTLQVAGELEQCLQGPDASDFFHAMFGNEPLRWDAALTGHRRLRFATNVLTRIRFVTADGSLDLETKEGAGAAPAGLVPWFEAHGRLTQGVPIAFGHWSTLGLITRPDLLSLDTGCVWGGRLTAVRVDGGRREVIQVECEQAQRPG
ncbi:symmetrical bis(5'-nucleosyl)-tetraphosphatase [soil metagenome]